VYVNYAMVDEDVALVLRERVFPIETDREKSAEEFLASDAWAMGFIGACVVNKRDWAAVRSDAYVGTYYAHVGTIFEYLRGRSVHLVARPVVLNRSGRPGVYTWKSSTFGVLTGGAGWSTASGIYPADVCEPPSPPTGRVRDRLAPFFAYLRPTGR
jgi:hypothetical protein